MPLPLRALAFALPALVSPAQSLPTPSQFLGFEVGSDRQLADYPQICSYFRALEKGSKRIQVESLGKTTLGKDLLMAVISSEGNLRARAKHQAIARKLADPRGLSPAQIEALAQEGRSILLVTCSIHSSEIGASQMALEWAHALVTAKDPETLRRLEEVILLLVPSLNPDGHQMEVEWYRKQLGTPFEGGRMPWLYHWFVGHDNNRDWVNLTQKESQHLNRAVYRDWNPQIWLDEHQMGSTGARIFLPPYSNPVAPSVHPLIWRTVDSAATFMTWKLEQAGRAGALSGAMFDAYWPGGTKNTAWWKNTAGMLSEVASVRLATPVEVHSSELQAGAKGFAEYRAQVNFPNPWKGGRWRLRDIMDYERLISDALLEHSARNRVDLLKGKAAMALDSVRLGQPEAFWKISLAQHDPPTAARLARLMLAHEVEVQYSETEQAFYIPTAQPYGRFVAELFSAQRYPEVRPTPGAPVLPPYDVAAWSLPLHFGVDIQRAHLSAQARNSLRPARSSDGPTGGLAPGKGVLYALPRTSNAATPLLNEYLRKGGSARVALEGFEAQGTAFAPGTLLLEPRSELAEVASRHGLLLQPLSQKPEVQSRAQKAPRVATYKPWAASMDEGWTRFLIEEAGFKPTSLDNAALRAGKLRDRIDVLVLADMNKNLILEGRRSAEPGYAEELPPEFSGGIGKEGAKAIRDFVEAGGTLVALGDATDFAIEELKLPVRNALAARGDRDSEFNCPGSLLRVQLDTGHPVTWGMPKEAAAFLKNRLAFQTWPASPATTHSVLAAYPEDRRDILLAGWIQGAERLQSRSAALAFTLGQGKVVLFGFSVQHRAQTEGTFKLLFNALAWGGME